jgi:hypothetical protein
MPNAMNKSESGIICDGEVRLVNRVCRETGKEWVVKVHCGVANHIGPEPCAGVREETGEAPARDSIGRPLSREIDVILGAWRCSVGGRQHGRARYCECPPSPARSQRRRGAGSNMNLPRRRSICSFFRSWPASTASGQTLSSMRSFGVKPSPHTQRSPMS